MNAQQIELNVPLTLAHTPGGNSLPFVKIHGVGLAEIAQSANLQGKNIAVYGGMAAGLPLANPGQAGVLFTGTIYQSYGIAYNLERSLNIYTNQTASQTADQTTANPPTPASVPVGVTNTRPANLVFNWVQGQNILDAIQATLAVAFPQYKIQGNVSPNLVLTGAPVVGFFYTFRQFAEFIYQKSRSIISGYAPNGNYLGVCMVAYANTINISDGTTQTTPKQIQFLDLQGQPTWSQPSEVQVTVTMRADINPLDYIILPSSPGIVTAGSQSQFYNVPGAAQAQGSYASAKNGSIFSGTFAVRQVWHLGNSRGPLGTDWVTTLDCLLQSKSPAQEYQNQLTALQQPKKFGFYVPV